MARKLSYWGPLPLAFNELRRVAMGSYMKTMPVHDGYTSRKNAQLVVWATDALLEHVHSLKENNTRWPEAQLLSDITAE